MIIDIDKIKKKGLYLDYVIFKSFIGIMKQMNHYRTIRFILGNYSIKPLSRVWNKFGPNINNEFSYCEDLTDALHILSCSHVPTIFNDKTTNKQFEILIKINYLLHAFVDGPITNNLQQLDEIAEKIFKDACKNYFGENFVDLSKKIDRQLKIDKKLGSLNELELNGLSMPF